MCVMCMQEPTESANLLDFIPVGHLLSVPLVSLPIGRREQSFLDHHHLIYAIHGVQVFEPLPWSQWKR